MRLRSAAKDAAVPGRVAGVLLGFLGWFRVGLLVTGGLVGVGMVKCCSRVPFAFLGLKEKAQGKAGRLWFLEGFRNEDCI